METVKEHNYIDDRVETGLEFEAESLSVSWRVNNENTRVDNRPTAALPTMGLLYDQTLITRSASLNTVPLSHTGRVR